MSFPCAGDIHTETRIVSAYRDAQAAHSAALDAQQRATDSWLAAETLLSQASLMRDAAQEAVYRADMAMIALCPQVEVATPTCKVFGRLTFADDTNMEVWIDGIGRITLRRARYGGWLSGGDHYAVNTVEAASAITSLRALEAE